MSLLGVLWALATSAQHLFGASGPAIAHDMLIHSPIPNGSAYRAIYMTVGGTRTLVSSACMMFANPAGYLYLASAFAVLAIYGVVLPIASRARLALLVFVSLLPMTVISIIAIDYGRWLSFAVFNWWLINAALHLREIDDLTVHRWPLRRSLVAGVAIVAMGPASYNAATFVTSKVANRLWLAHSTEYPLDRCDPTWRSVVTAKAKPQS